MRAGRITAIVAIAVVAIAGCGSDPAPAPPQAQPTTSPPDPVTVCTNQLVYWAGEQLRGAPDKGWDYQHMGLTGEENDALDAVVARARVEGEGVVAELARQACADLATRPTSAPWGTGGTT